MSRKHGWVLVQDTAWSGYEEIPNWIMQGYTTMAQEIASQINGITPTHLFLQAGVGSMAGAVLGYFAGLWQNNLPVTVICEPDKAACLYKTAAANDGTLHKVTGRMNSMMAGLCCGEPCTVSWDIINNFASAFIACSDDYAASGMRLLGMPQSGDARIVSGESGAVTAGVLAAQKISRPDDLKIIRPAYFLFVFYKFPFVASASITPSPACTRTGTIIFCPGCKSVFCKPFASQIR